MELWTQVRHTISNALPGFSPEQIRIPARSADCDCYLPGEAAPAPAAFGALLGAPLVKQVRPHNDRLLISLTNEFFDACVKSVNKALPTPAHDQGDLALNRMLRYARHGGDGCPPRPQVQRALWLCAGANESPSLANQAAHAFLTMFHGIPPAERQALLNECGAASMACAKLYARIYPL